MSDPKTAPGEDVLKRAQEIYERLMREHGFDFYNARRPASPPAPSSGTQAPAARSTLPRTAPPAGTPG